MGGNKASVVAIDSNNSGSFVKNMNFQAESTKDRPNRATRTDRSPGHPRIPRLGLLASRSAFMEERKNRRAGRPIRRKMWADHQSILVLRSKLQPVSDR